MLLRSLEDLQMQLRADGHSQRIVLAFGVFDGVHLGHQTILSVLSEKANEMKAVPVAVFFSPHPRAVLCPPGPKHLSTLEYKCKLLEESGAAYVVAMPFTLELAQLEAFDFLDRYFLSGELDVQCFCVGDNWRFGRGNSAGVEELRRWAEQHGKQACIVPCLSLNGGVVSSTRIRKLVESGRLDEAAGLLGRPFAVEGGIIHGIELGRKMDCPTANIVDDMQVLPPSGVYAASAQWEGKQAGGIVYVGNAPTFGRNTISPWLELHLFDWNEQLYGKQLLVVFHGFIREERTFASQEALAAQIQMDIRVAKSVIESVIANRN